MSTQDSPKPVAWMMVNSTNPRLTPSVTLTPETGWHITWEALPLYDQAAVDAAVAAERERCKRIIQLNQYRNGHHTHEGTTMGHYDVRMIAEIDSGQPPKA
jgi:hypothetical protein